MKFTIEDLEAEITLIVTGLAELRKSKGHDYAGDEDTFSDLRPLGVDYCCKRLIQKAFRVLQLLEHPPAVKTDSLEAEFGDIINFSLYMPILHRQLIGGTNEAENKEAEEETSPFLGRYSSGWSYCGWCYKWYPREKTQDHLSCVSKNSGGKTGSNAKVPGLGDWKDYTGGLPVGKQPVHPGCCDEEHPACRSVQNTPEGDTQEETR